MGDERHAAPKTICGYPLKGWRLQRVEYDDGRAGSMAPGWIVSLHTDSTHPFEDRRRYRCVMTRSLLGSLEAWDEAITIAQRENELAASAIEAATAGETPKSGSTEGESAIPQGDARNTPSTGAA